MAAIVEKDRNKEVLEVELSDDTRLERTDRFCYLGNMLSVGGGAEMALTTRISKAWNNFREHCALLALTSVPEKIQG